MQVFLVSIATSLIGALIYGLLISKYEERIRQWLRNMPKGWVRRRYVAAFVGAVRGKARESDTEVVNYILMVYPVALLFLTAVLYGTLSPMNKRLRTRLATGVIEPPWELRKVVTEGDALLFQTSVLAIVLAAVILVFLVVVIPFRVFRSRFSYELDRMLDYLRAIAHKDELAKLMLIEQKVKDEESLKAFAGELIALSQKYGCGGYASPLWIWGDVTKAPAQLEISAGDKQPVRYV